MNHAVVNIRLQKFPQICWQFPLLKKRRDNLLRFNISSRLIRMPPFLNPGRKQVKEAHNLESKIFGYTYWRLFQFVSCKFQNLIHIVSANLVPVFFNDGNSQFSEGSNVNWSDLYPLLFIYFENVII